MKKTYYIYIMCAALALFAACNDDDVLSPTYSVGEADNTITLSAGISEGRSGVQTRSVDGNHSAGSNGGGHKTLDSDTKLRLRVDGTWLGKTSGTLAHGSISGTKVSQTTTASIGTPVKVGTEAEATHNEVSFNSSEKLFWDDYGTADPDNINTPNGNASGNGGRNEGLTIYGVAVSGKALPTDTEGRTNLTNFSDWKNISWNVGKPSDTTPGVIDQSTNGWGDYDLLTSNNIRNGGDGTYKFDDAKGTSGDTPSDIIEFTHAMTKITVNLTANNGFTVPTDGTYPTFKENVSVTLLGFNYMGKVDVEGKTSQPTDASWNPVDGSHSAATANIKAKLMEGGKDAHTAKFEALVFPGNTFNAIITEDSEGNKTVSSSDPLLELNADGNIYKVTAAQLVKAIKNATATGSYEGTLAQGVNYVINIIVNKTEVKVNATVMDWETVNSDEVSPVINVNTSFSGSGSATPTGFDSFSFYRSASDPASQAQNKLSGYSAGTSLKENDFYKPEGTPSGTLNSSTKWDFGTGNTLYWPNHNTHYHFRGVWPTTSTGTDDTETVPHVKAVSNDDATQVIDIKNVAYSSGSFPSDLLIGMPEFTEANKTCANEDHTHVDQSEYGICATEGLITLNFKYIMSQVEVILSTSDAGSIDYVNIGANTKVEIVNVYNNGYVKLGDRTVVGTDTNQDQTYELNAKPTAGLSVAELITAQRTRHSAIVPQSFIQGDPGASTNTRFKITVTNDDAVMYTKDEYNAAKGTYHDDTAFANLSETERTKTPATQDIYFADIKPIQVAKDGESTPKDITAWESDVHYKYNLKLTKTEIKVTATITDWVKVNASQDVWF